MMRSTTLTAEKSGPIASIDEEGLLTVDAEQRPEDSQVTIRFHQGTTEAVAFLFRTFRASRRLRVISMVQLRGDNTEVTLDLGTPARVSRFLKTLDRAFVPAEEMVDAA